MTATAGRRRGGVGFGVFTLAMVAVFVGLGVWQLQRRVEKHALVAALTERLAAAPGSLPPPAQWSALAPASDEFRRVSFKATYASGPDAMVYSSGSAVREDISGPGTWAFMPARLPTGETVVINAGFVQNTMQDRAQQDRAVTRLVTGEPVTLTGYIRFPETAGMLTPAENLAKRLWFTRDHLAMARVARLGRGRAVLHRSGAAGAGQRHSQAGDARGASEGRSPAIRHHLVRPGRRRGDSLRGLVERAGARSSPWEGAEMNAFRKSLHSPVAAHPRAIRLGSTNLSCQRYSSLPCPARVTISV